MRNDPHLKIGLYANNIGPSQNLALIAVEALKRKHRVAFMGNMDVTYLMQHAIMGPGDPNSLHRRDVFITGLSSPENEFELQLGAYAKALDISWIVVADTHRSWGREEAKGKIDNAILIIASPLEIDDALEFGYKQVVYLGGPPLWQEYTKIKPAKIERTASVVILVGGTRQPALTNRILSRVIASMDLICGQGLWQLVFKPHPNESLDDNAESKQIREMLLRGVKEIKTLARTTTLLKSVNVSVLVGGSTDHIAASYMRLPSVSYEDEEVSAGLENATGTRDWFPSKSGAVIRADDNNMTEVLRKLLAKDRARHFKDMQRMAYPIRKTGGELAETAIIRFVEELIV